MTAPPGSTFRTSNKMAYPFFFPSSVNGPYPSRSFVYNDSIREPVISVQDIGFEIRPVLPHCTDPHISSRIIIIEHSLCVSHRLYGPSFTIDAPLGPAIGRKRLAAIKSRATAALIITRARSRSTITGIIPGAGGGSIISRAGISTIIPLTTSGGGTGRSAVSGPAVSVKGLGRSVRSSVTIKG